MGTKRKAAEFMQYRSPEGGGPSVKTCPRCESPWRLRTSVRVEKNRLSSRVTMFSGTSGLVKLGQPVPESNLSRELKSGSPDTTSTYSPSALLSQ